MLHLLPAGILSNFYLLNFLQSFPNLGHFSLIFISLDSNKVYSLDIIVRLKQNTISYTTSQTAYMSTALTVIKHAKLQT